jgi:hypothetical protein
MRLQLTAALLLVSASAWAEGDGQARVTLFRENSTRNDGITVVHPQADFGGDLGSALHFSAGYNADIVSGATPAIFAPSKGPDAITSATKFTDTRHAAHASFDYVSGTVGLTVGYDYATEHDYQSHAVSVGARGDLFDRNLTLGMSYTHNFDSVCDANNKDQGGQELQPLERHALASSAHCFQANQMDVLTRSLDIDTFEPTLTWTASPRVLIQAGGTVQILNGFQSNPYRSVLVGSEHRTPQEAEPLERQRFAIFARAAYAIPAMRASLSLMGRGYWDTWAVRAGSGEVAFQKYLANWLLFRARGRYHRQGAAKFYRTADDYRSLGPAGQYWTGDRELSPMHNWLVGGRLSYLQASQEGRPVWGVFNQIEIGLAMDYLIYGLDSTCPPGVDECAPNADRDHAFIVQSAFVLRW